LTNTRQELAHRIANTTEPDRALDCDVMNFIAPLPDDDGTRRPTFERPIAPHITGDLDVVDHWTKHVIKDLIAFSVTSRNGRVSCNLWTQRGIFIGEGHTEALARCHALVLAKPAGRRPQDRQEPGWKFVGTYNGNMMHVLFAWVDPNDTRHLLQPIADVMVSHHQWVEEYQRDPDRIPMIKIVQARRVH
jgi:hypothetical protein